MFHGVGLRDKNDDKLIDRYKSYFQKVLAYDVKSIAFCYVTTGIHSFVQRKVVVIAFATVRLYLESNHSSVDCVIFCPYEL